MDVYISEEYVIQRRIERKMKKNAAAIDAGKQGDKASDNESLKKKNRWNVLDHKEGNRIENQDLVFSCFSA